MLKLTPDEINKNTYWSKQKYGNMKKMIEKYENDNEKNRRQEELECKSCYYLRNGMAGQAFTKFNCWNCESEQVWHNSNHPKYCEKCSKEHSACRRCGASI